MTVRGLAGARSLRAFRHRNFRLFYVGQAISLVGSWMQAVAQSWLVLVLTNDPLMLGLLAAAQWLPVLFLGLFGGLIADALPKRQTLIVVESLMGVLAIVLGLLTLTGVVEVWMVLLLAVFLGCLNAVEMPVRQSFAVEMVGREDIVNAIALNSAVFNGARVVGPAIAGIAIAAFDISIAFLINGLSYIAVVAALLLMREAELHLRPPIARPHSAREVVASVGEGVGYVRSTPLVLFAVVTVGLAATIGMNFQVTIAPFARDTLGGDASTFGFLMTASGLGSVTAALFLATRHRASARAIGVGAVGLGTGLVVAALLPVFGVALVAMFVAGAGADLDGGKRQHAHPGDRAGRAAGPGHERLHDGLRRLDPVRRHRRGGACVRARRGGRARDRRGRDDRRGYRRPHLASSAPRARRGRRTATRVGGGVDRPGSPPARPRADRPGGPAGRRDRGIARGARHAARPRRGRRRPPLTELDPGSARRGLARSTSLAFDTGQARY
jgi:MFS family permease